MRFENADRSKGGNNSSCCRPSYDQSPGLRLKLNSTRNLDDAVQSTAADAISGGDLTECWAINIEQDVTGPV